MKPRHLLTALALLFFLAPLGLRAAGVTARPFENRPLAPVPSLDAGWDVFDETTRFFTDRMPLREQAVRAQSWAARHLLAVSPTWRRDLLADQANTAALPQDKQLEPAAPAEQRAATPGSRVVEGAAGWLFLSDDLERACEPTIPWPVVVERLETIARAIRESGREVVIAVPPDKSTVYPERLGDAVGRRYACAERNRREYWPLLERSREPALLALRASMAAAKRTTGDELYRSTDSHWNTVGASVAVRAILEHLGGAVRVRPGELVAAPRLTYTGDLTTLLGSTEKSTTPERIVRRAAGAPKLPGDTLFMADSYGLYNASLLAPYVQKLTNVPWPGTAPDAIVAAVVAADRVILQIVERELNIQLGDTGPFAALLAAAQAGLPPRPG